MLPPIIPVDKLVALRASPTPPRILDASFVPGAPDEAYNNYLAGPRIPGATYWDVAKIATRGEAGRNLPFMMPDSALGAAGAGAHGLSAAVPIVVYDRAGVFAAPRTVYTLRAYGFDAALLDGGLPAWQTAGGELDTGEMSAQPTHASTCVEPKLDATAVASFEEVRANVDSDTRVPVLDARGPGMFDGTIATGTSPVRGHIPHSLSLPFGSVLESEPYTHYKSEPELVAAFERVLGAGSIAALQRSGRVVTTCAGGLTAAILWLALEMLGVRAAVYDESWMGWSARAAAGEAPVATSADDAVKGDAAQ